MLDFYSDGWGACVRLDVETLSDTKVIEFSKNNFISIKLKPFEDKTAEHLFEKFRGQGIPLIVFLNHEGIEVDRLLGFYSPDEYLNRVTDIYNQVDTFLSLKNQFTSGDLSTGVLSKLSEKCKLNPNPEFCELVYSEVISTADTLPESVSVGAKLFFAKKDLDNGDTRSMNTLIQSILDINLVADAYMYLIRHYQIAKDIEKESAMYRKYSDNMRNNPSVLNSYAWRMTELNMNLDDALLKSNTAIDLSFDNPSLQSYILDTKAEILWLLKRTNEALKVIDMAIEIDPSSTYFLEQKEKFLNSLR